VRNLAQRTQKATEDIQALIQQLQQGRRYAVKVMEDSQSKTEISVQQASQAAALESITQAVSVINDHEHTDRQRCRGTTHSSRKH
jgi:methyl-accepting chemotaxis protein